MTHRFFSLAASACRIAAVFAATAVVQCALAADPFASNNGFYPLDKWTGPYRTLNFNYPEKAPAGAQADWLRTAPRAALTTATAPAYTALLKKFVEPAMRAMIEQPSAWSPQQVGWYDMPWQADGSATGGREAILGSFAGQVLPPNAFAGLSVPMQNHTVVYYDARSATMLKKLWANPFNPDRSAVVFPEGAMVVKAAAVTVTPEQWPVLAGSAAWQVWRPPVAGTSGGPKNSAGQQVNQASPQLLPLRVLQFDIIVKDSVAAPQTGWVFTTFVHKLDAPGATPWDKLTPLGAQWGNDPQLALSPSGLARGASPGAAVEALQETWINPAAPDYSKQTLGWGGRLSGPIDLAKRHNVIFTDGVVRKEQRSSSCMGCHSTAQYPFIANLYPSPNRAFPPDGSPFLLYTPGSPDWARWFQNRPGTQAFNQSFGAAALDYDMLIMLALSAFDAAAGGDRYLQERPKVH